MKLFELGVLSHWLNAKDSSGQAAKKYLKSLGFGEVTIANVSDGEIALIPLTQTPAGFEGCEVQIARNHDVFTLAIWVKGPERDPLTALAPKLSTDSTGSLGFSIVYTLPHARSAPPHLTKEILDGGVARTRCGELWGYVPAPSPSAHVAEFVIALAPDGDASLLQGHLMRYCCSISKMAHLYRKFRESHAKVKQRLDAQSTVDSEKLRRRPAELVRAVADLGDEIDAIQADLASMSEDFHTAKIGSDNWRSLLGELEFEPCDPSRVSIFREPDRWLRQMTADRIYDEQRLARRQQRLASLNTLSQTLIAYRASVSTYIFIFLGAASLISLAGALPSIDWKHLSSWYDHLGPAGAWFQGFLPKLLGLVFLGSVLLLAYRSVLGRTVENPGVKGDRGKETEKVLAGSSGDSLAGAALGRGVSVEAPEGREVVS